MIASAASAATEIGGQPGATAGPRGVTQLPTENVAIIAPITSAISVSAANAAGTIGGQRSAIAAAMVATQRRTECAATTIGVAGSKDMDCPSSRAFGDNRNETL